ncbi:hypothetical protein [Desertivibrio insolitus]|uniref:hypothetical protein n=1 Tax=Herbiconiux sp. SYSU D00978 TaxID=2812562 RepID=UPI001A961E39|nr:hypothetical protein [Herbiconiux sp. SYSU D00978]
MLALSGCSTDGAASDYDLATAEQLQSQVYTVSDLAAQSKHAEALTALDEIVAAAEAALSSGKIDRARYDRIMLAVEQVRGTLGTIIAEAERAALEQQLADQQAELDEQQSSGGTEDDASGGGTEDDSGDEDSGDDETSGNDDSGTGNSGNGNSGSGNSGNGNTGNSGNGNSGNGNSGNGGPAGQPSPSASPAPSSPSPSPSAGTGEDGDDD